MLVRQRSEEKKYIVPTWRGNDKLPESEKIVVEVNTLDCADFEYLNEARLTRSPSVIHAMSIQIFAKYVTGIRNLLLEGGLPITNGKDWITRVAEGVMPLEMASLQGEILAELVVISSVTKAEEKN